MVDYNDERFQKVNQEQAQDLSNVTQTYDNLINQSNMIYQDAQARLDQNTQEQKALAQEGTDLALKQVEQDKEWARQDYEKEQRGAYADYQKQANTYGVNNENLAASGLLNTGYSESSRIAMWNSYQNRYAVARQTFERGQQQYNQSMAEIKQTGNSNLMKIASESLQQSLQLALDGFQNQNKLIQTQLSAQNEVKDRYYSRWQDTLKQINTENEFAEQKRQFNASLSASKSSGGSSVPAITKDGGTSKVNASNLQDTGFNLDGWQIYKSGGKYYYQMPNGNLQELPVMYEAGDTITFDDGTVIAK
jgi:hypothetical protein